jgi:hypothetical protein
LLDERDDKSDTSLSLRCRRRRQHHRLNRGGKLGRQVGPVRINDIGRLGLLPGRFILAASCLQNGNLAGF